MANCISNTGIQHEVVNLKDEKQVIESLARVCSCDCDLTENEEYFRKDTLSLGYNSEADRILKEYIKKKGVPKTVKDFEKAYSHMAKKISSQEYFGSCKTSLIKIDEAKVSVVFVYGGNY